MLVAELPFDTQAKRGAVRNTERLAVEVVGQDRLRVEAVNQVDALVIHVGAAAIVVSAMHDREACVGLEARCLEERSKLRALPLANCAPAFDAVVAGDLSAGRQRAQVCKREVQRPLDQTVDA